MGYRRKTRFYRKDTCNFSMLGLSCLCGIQEKRSGKKQLELGENMHWKYKYRHQQYPGRSKNHGHGRNYQEKARGTGSKGLEEH